MRIRALEACLAVAALAVTALPCEAQRSSSDRHARAGVAPSAATTAPRMPGARPDPHWNERHHGHSRHNYHAPRFPVAPRVIVISRPVTYVAPPVYVAAPAAAALTSYAPQLEAVSPPPPHSSPSAPGAWRSIAGPYLALDGASFVAGGVTYVLTGLRAWDPASPQGAAARARLQQLLESGAVAVWHIALDGYGRAMVRVIVDGTELANQMRAEGFTAG